MKKNTIMIVMLLVAMFATQAMAVTFPVAKDALVVSNGEGVVTVNAPGESGWILVQYCQDNLRAGAPNNLVIKPSQDSNGTMVFQLDKSGVGDGQVAFNFKKDGHWLHLPDCRVKTGSNVGLGNSYRSPDIEESGGAMFVYTGSGIAIQYPIDVSYCGAAAKAKSAKTNATASKAVVVPGGVGVVSNSTASQAVGAVNKSSAANTAGDEVVGSPMNVVVKVGTCGGKKLKKGETCQNGHTVNVYAVKHGDTNVSQKGHVNKNISSKDKVFIYNGPVYNIHGGKYGESDCTSCHNQTFWNNHNKDKAAQEKFFKQMSSSMSEKKKGHKK
jgi:hypothetical protein